MSTNGSSAESRRRAAPMRQRLRTRLPVERYTTASRSTKQSPTPTPKPAIRQLKMIEFSCSDRSTRWRQSCRRVGCGLEGDAQDEYRDYLLRTRADTAWRERLATKNCSSRS